ncbi:uncharacterized protein LACBIDRAFT_317718 [Laccaria bicolor S238N-H82]|uniref:Predicted protein n=1 Tax=Laccaria bicolor (strain S238N-H82 / ATCC MYA-4686) TaxID=486041 RepID=B0E578_LACBS|nr:uncharacterized protein LACBIDRAFT_317718 [Laccaria bicolor S238N-H82]EDQ98003.1 predicted protein [Laccaria bicolor S238N-H82]|eukprot:XP_001891345.1 predicted protein [Laccaria bicolor S238N-H82]
MSIRDTNVVIIETGRTVVRAGLGLHDLLKTPTVEIQARVGLRQTAFKYQWGFKGTSLSFEESRWDI